MNDFLQSLRNGNHKRFDGNRKYNNNYNNRGNDRQRGRDNRNDYGNRAIGKDYFPVLKQALEDISQNQKRIADANERRALAEERKANALESIAKRLCQLTGAEASADLQDLSETPISLPDCVSTKESLDDTPPSSDTFDQEKVLQIIQDMRGDNVSYEKIAAFLTAEEIPTASGRGKWRGQMVSKLYQQAT